MHHHGGDPLKFDYITDKGAVRQENQDSAFITEVRSRGCLAAVVCDGMGGVHGGKLAGELAVSGYMAELRRSLIASSDRKPDVAKAMDEACRSANQVVYKYSVANTESAGMGTTLVAATIRGRTAEIVNIGDSRAYLIDRKTIRRITKDHSLVESLVDSGQLTPEEAEHHPQKNIITRAIGVDPIVAADHFTVKLHIGHKLLLCSDGITNALSEQELFAICTESRKPDRICRRLIAAALDHHASDNITAVLIQA